MTVDIRLVFLAPASIEAAMEAGLGASAKFADNERLFKGNAPLRDVSTFRTPLVPAYLFVEADHIEGIAE